ncbi:MAG: LysR family transcriptional regulator [Flavipsychrobacter sp.]|nr:LysR family transcriptional regulator [Flavipsychrobacter sp.]
MLDFRLRVFHTVAKLLNFTKAAGVLNVTQPAVTKHIKELEQEYKVTLFDRQPNALALTEAGQLLYRHAINIMEQYELLDFDMNAIHNKLIGDLHVGASTTIAQYVLGPVLASFHKRYPDVQVHLTNENSNHIIQLLLQKDIDMGFVEGKTNNNSVQYTQYIEDELVLVCSAKNPLYKKQDALLTDITTLPFVMREGDSGTYEILEEHLKKAGINIARLKVKMHLASTEGIKQFVEYSDHFAFLSIYAIANELNRGALRIINVKGLDMHRHFHIVQRQGQPLPIAESFVKFIRNYNKK